MNKWEAWLIVKYQYVKFYILNPSKFWKMFKLKIKGICGE